MKKLGDLELLAFACLRANRIKEEGRAYFAAAVLRDNMQQYRKAIALYTSFLRICRECRDTQGCGLAYHCLGVDHQLLAEKLLVGVSQDEGGGVDRSGRVTTAPGPGAGSNAYRNALKKAILFHNKHRETADSVGRFVAHLNMGIAYRDLGDTASARTNFQHALKYAHHLSSMEGQCVAIGNLGLTEPAPWGAGTAAQMRPVIEKYLSMAAHLKREDASSVAYQRLGQMAASEGDYTSSCDYYAKALDAALRTGDKEAEQTSHIHLGVAAARANLQEHFTRLLQQTSTSTAIPIPSHQDNA